jgi:hypothetical protein
MMSDDGSIVLKSYRYSAIHLSDLSAIKSVQWECTL